MYFWWNWPVVDFPTAAQRVRWWLSLSFSGPFRRWLNIPVFSIHSSDPAPDQPQRATHQQHQICRAIQADQSPAIRTGQSLPIRTGQSLPIQVDHMARQFRGAIDAATRWWVHFFRSSLDCGRIGVRCNLRSDVIVGRVFPCSATDT